MGLDVRLPIGAMFALLGLLLAIYGLITSGDPRVYERSLLIDINLWWGLVMLAFGVVMLVFARRGRAAEGVHPATQTVEGRITEAREHALGLEKDE